MKRELEVIQVHIPQCMKTLENLQDEQVYFIGATPILAGTFGSSWLSVGTPRGSLFPGASGPGRQRNSSLDFRKLTGKYY